MSILAWEAVAEPTERFPRCHCSVIQELANGDIVVGWGSLPYFSEFDSSGHLVFNAEFPAGVNTYRAYRLPFNETPGWWNQGQHQH